MAPGAFISIDQNSHVFWDTVPKLHALARHGWTGTHCVEDIDVAFTRQGAALDDASLQLAPERYYRTGNSDWGAALFYTDFLGRNPINIRALEPYTGLSTVGLAKRLGLSVDALYERYASSDNWQLIGTSYLGDTAHHRVIGDLGVRDVEPFLRELVAHARRDIEERFPETAARQRIGPWFAAESAKLEPLLATRRAAALVDLYRDWLRTELPPAIELSLTSAAFPPVAAAPRLQLLALFLADYGRWAGLYNEAIAETASALRPLRLESGELPFFAVWRRDGRLLRTNLALADGRLVEGGREWLLEGTPPLPALEAMRRDGLVCLCGKALLLVLQARLIPGGAPLALPHNGSRYMPAAWRFEAKLRAADLLPWPTHPVLRVRLGFLRHWANCATIIRLPPYLAGAFSAAELPASQFAAELPTTLQQAAAELEMMKTPDGRGRVAARLFPAESAAIVELEARRRDLARRAEDRAEASHAWDEKQTVERRLLAAMAGRALRHLHVSDLDYWDSRGAILPWAVALGGTAFYDRILEEVQITEETVGERVTCGTSDLR